jgi:hypothetical protein
LLLLISENDGAQADHVGIVRKLEQALQQGGADARLIVYPPYGSDGHRLFFQLGSYWRDVEQFLSQHL